MGKHSVVTEEQVKHNEVHQKEAHRRALGKHKVTLGPQKVECRPLGVVHLLVVVVLERHREKEVDHHQREGDHRKVQDYRICHLRVRSLHLVVKSLWLRVEKGVSENLYDKVNQHQVVGLVPS